MHKGFELGVGFSGDFSSFIETGEQGSDCFSFIGENEIVIAGFASILMQVEIAPIPIAGIFHVLGVVQVAEVGKVWHQIGELAGVVILLIVPMFEDPDLDAVGRVGVGVKLDPLVQFKNAANVGKGVLSAIEAIGRAYAEPVDAYSAQYRRIPVVKVDKIEFACQFCRFGSCIAGLTVASGIVSGL